MSNSTRFLGSQRSVLGLVMVLAAATSGCGSNAPVGGLTNPNAGSVVDRDKASTRTDMAVPPAKAGGAGVDEASSTSPAGSGSNAGTGGPGGGQPGADSAKRDQPADASTSPPASPPAKQNAGNASGGTRPADKIEVGSPRSPQ